MIVITTQCFPPDLGGIENLMGGLAAALVQRGERVLVFADRAKPGKTFAIEGLDIKRYGGFKPFRRRLKAFDVARLVRRGGVKGVFADSWKSAELLAPLDSPIAILAHGMELPASASDAKRARIRASFAKARRVIANSTYTASLAEPYIADPKRLLVINPPIGPQRDADSNAAEDLKRIIAGRGPVMLSLCRLEPRKGVDTMIRVLPRILKAHPHALYIIAGGGSDHPRLEHLVREQGVGAHVHFTGPVSDDMKAALYSQSDVFVMPTRREGNSVEGFGIVYLEAGWYGRACLAGRDGGAVDAVRDGITGLLCNASDADDVLVQTLKLLANQSTSRSFGRAAQARARGEAQWSSAVQEYVTALQ